MVLDHGHVLPGNRRMAAVTTAPTVRTMEPEDAHPLYLESLAVRVAVLRFAAHLPWCPGISMKEAR